MPGVRPGSGQGLSKGPSNLLEPKCRLAGRFDGGVGHQCEVRTSDLNPFAFGRQSSDPEGRHCENQDPPTSQPSHGSSDITYAGNEGKNDGSDGQ